LAASVGLGVELDALGLDGLGSETSGTGGEAPLTSGAADSTPSCELAARSAWWLFCAAVASFEAFWCWAGAGLEVPAVAPV
jgi:hypothetical protein